MLTAAQLRAARGLLDWTRNDLAKAAGISSETVKNIEHGTFRPQETTSDAIIKAFALYDVQFTENEGVRIARDAVKQYQGGEGFRQFMDDVYAAAQNEDAFEGGKKPICVSNVDDRLFVKYLGGYTQTHVDRMNKLKNTRVRVLTGDKNFYRATDGGYLEYRWNPNQSETTVPFYVYGDKFSIVIFEENKPQVIVISSALVAKAYREQFEVLWQNAKK